VQASFSDLEYDTKKRLTRRDRFLAEIESVTPWTLLVVHSSSTDPKQAGLAADAQFVATVNHLSALSNPALVSAPLKKSISSDCWPILACKGPRSSSPANASHSLAKNPVWHLSNLFSFAEPLLLPTTPALWQWASNKITVTSIV